MKPTSTDNNSPSSENNKIEGLDYALLSSLKEVEVNEVSDDQNLLDSQLIPTETNS